MPTVSPLPFNTVLEISAYIDRRKQPELERKGKIISICRWQDYISEKPKILNEKSTNWREISKVAGY